MFLIRIDGTRRVIRSTCAEAVRLWPRLLARDGRPIRPKPQSPRPPRPAA
jgi:hypothetical protein